MRTAESVSPSHPDKLCDRISDAILDACLEQDPNSRVAIETMGGHGKVYVTGELTTTAKIDVFEIVPKVLGRGAAPVGIHTNIVTQSPEIAQGVDTGGAGDQGIMIGYATSETPELMPLEVMLARNLNRFIYDRHPYDGKTQVTIDDNGKLSSVVASFQRVPTEKLEALVDEFFSDSKYAENVAYKVFVNPAGDWDMGGFDADTGLTGRKLIVDNYGPTVPIGGGCFSGKDPSKVDRSAAYMARKIAVDYLTERKAKEVVARLAYAIGYDKPLEATVIIDGKQEDIKGYDLRPNAIIEFLDLRKPIYSPTACYGHFGNNFAWDLPKR